MSLVSVGLPSSRKTLLFNGIGVTIRLDKSMNSISMFGIFPCDREYCGSAARENGQKTGRITYIPTTKVVNEIVAVETAIVHRLNVTSFSAGWGPTLVLGPDNQVLHVNFQVSPSQSSFYTLSDASSVLQATKTEALKAEGCANEDWNCRGYSKPLVHDGTQYWLYSSDSGDVVSSLDSATKWALGSNDRRLSYGAAAANDVLWLRDSRDSVKSFSVFNITTRSFLRKFYPSEHSQVAKNMNGYSGRFFFTLSLDGSIVYLVEVSVYSETNRIHVLGMYMPCDLCSAR